MIVTKVTKFNSYECEYQDPITMERKIQVFPEVVLVAYKVQQITMPIMFGRDRDNKHYI